jgi:hypothetical protein
LHTRPAIDLSEEVFAEADEAPGATDESEELVSPFEVPGEPDAEEQAPTAEADATGAGGIADAESGAGLADAADEEQAGQDPHATDAAEPEASSTDE